MKKIQIYKFISFLVISFLIAYSIGFISFFYLVISKYSVELEISHQSNFVVVATENSQADGLQTLLPQFNYQIQN